MGGTATHDGMAGCTRVDTEAIDVEDAIRKSYCDAVRSVDVAIALLPEGITAKSRNGREGAV